MKSSTWVTALLIFTVGMSNVGYIKATETAAPADGTIRFAENFDGTGDSCVSPFTTQTFDFRSDDYGCTNDQMTYFRLENVPSATTFRLESERCDGTTHEWYFEMKTIQQPTRTDWISIADLESFDVGQVVVAGVQLKAKKTDTSVPREGKLSCVRIERSSLP